ncbi:hypothetical protein CBW65_22570 [Tumebacillus avium]|uniref:Abortive phage infection protein n=1 Tax=Tumebacillus avium TaxID=1903704 RepID=A0A1Y0IS51_9BACL|nr:AIPR family protein [Tumebacillus avium]ARU63472.1 hypothetical protein CBW65_22570 [Tumebacillus avium]
MITLDTFAKEFLEETLGDTQANNSSQEDTFTEKFCGYLVDAEECFDPQVCFFKKTGMKINAYEYREETDTLVLFISSFDAINHVRKINAKTIEDLFKRGKNFFVKSLGGLAETIEESHEAYALAHLIYEQRGNWSKLEVFVVTNGITNNQLPLNEDFDGINIIYRVWDIERLYQFAHQNIGPELLKINFVDEFGRTLQCLRTLDENEVYTSYVAIISGEMLAKIYEKWGQRLIERNVRSYLQATGKVNKGIRDTLLQEPHMFLAYNNGISTTAEKAVFSGNSETDETLALEELVGWQIVNGGQTTASLYYGLKHKQIDLSKAQVQMKLTILKDLSQADLVVSSISKYANSQTKINISDFNSNDKYHIALERLSRSIWAPNKDFRGKSTTMWFYERARVCFATKKCRVSRPFCA